MEILVDADACPVKEIIVAQAKARGIPVTMVIDNAHVLSDGYSRVITVDQGADSADLRLMNLCRRGDVVVTQDYGVAAMALGRGAWAISQNGLVYCDDNMDGLLFSRHMGKKLRRAGKRTPPTPKRTRGDDLAFETAFVRLLEQAGQTREEE